LYPLKNLDPDPDPGEGQISAMPIGESGAGWRACGTLEGLTRYAQDPPRGDRCAGGSRRCRLADGETGEG